MFPIPYAYNSWFGYISYLYLFEKSFAMETFIANETTAIAKESPNNLEINFSEGNCGSGKLLLNNLQKSANK